jgi:inosine-uridine nucleoside N-ribohydrolase
VLEIQKMRRLIIITDPSPLGDDAVAISLLAADRSLEIKLIVATSGNVWAEQAASNVFTLLARLCQ